MKALRAINLAERRFFEAFRSVITRSGGLGVSEADTGGFAGVAGRFRLANEGVARRIMMGFSVTAVHIGLYDVTTGYAGLLGVDSRVLWPAGLTVVAEAEVPVNARWVDPHLYAVEIEGTLTVSFGPVAYPYPMGVYVRMDLDDGDSFLLTQLAAGTGIPVTGNGGYIMYNLTHRRAYAVDTRYLK